MTSHPYQSEALNLSNSNQRPERVLPLQASKNVSSQDRRSLLQPLHDMPISGKQLAGFLTAETVSVLGLVGVGSVLLVVGGRNQLLDQATSELAVTDFGYNTKVDQMRSSIRGQTNNAIVINAARARMQGRPLTIQSRSQVRNLLRNEIASLDIEYATLVGNDLRIIANANANREGEVFDPDNLVSTVLSEGEPLKGNAIVPWEELAKEAPSLPDGVAGQDALIRYVVTPVVDPATNTIIGALISGDIVNQKRSIVEETVKAFGGGYSAIYSRHSDGEFRLATSLELEDEQPLENAETNVPLPNLSLLEQAVEARGNPVTQRLTIDGHLYTVAAQSINDSSAQPIAVLVRGTPEVGLNSLLRNSLLLQAVVILVVLLLDVGLAILIGESINQPIQRLRQTAHSFGAGDRKARAKVQSRNELGELASTFNKMADSVVKSEALLLDQVRSQALAADRSRLFVEVTSQIRRSLNVKDVLHRAVDGVRDILKVDRVIIYQLESGVMTGAILAESGGMTWANTIDCTLPEYPSPEAIDRYRAGQVWSASDLQTNDLQAIDLQAIASTEPIKDNVEYDAKLLKRLGATAGMTAPILMSNELFGLICVLQSGEPRRWQASDLELFQQLSIQIGFALDQANWLQQQRHLADLARKLNAITALVRESLDEERIYTTAVNGVQQLLETDRTLIYCLDESGIGTAVIGAIHPDWTLTSSVSLTPPYFMSGDIELLERGQVVTIDDIDIAGLPASRLHQLKSMNVRSLLAAPLLVDGQLIGILCTHACAKPRKWLEFEVQLFQQLSIQVGFALSQANLLYQQRVSAECARQLNDVTSKMRESLDEQRIFNTAVNGARQLLATDRALIYRFDPDGNGVAIAESLDKNFPTAAYFTLSAPYFTPGDLARYQQGQGVAIAHIDQANLSRSRVEQLQSLQVRSVLVSPLLVDGQLIGLLCVQACAAPRYWTESEGECLQQLAVQVGYALSQANLLQQQRSSAEFARKLNEITVEMRRSLDQQQIFNAAVVETQKLLAADRTLIYLRQQKEYGVIVAESVAPGWAETLRTVTAYPHLNRESIEKFKQGQILVIENVNLAGFSEHQLTQLARFQVVSEMVAPILVDGRLMGLLVVHQCSGSRNWNETEINFLSRVAIQLGFALEQATLLRKTEEFSREQRRQKEQIQAQLLQLLRDVEGAAWGDLTVRTNVTNGELGTVVDFFNAVVESLRQMVTNVKQSAIQVSEAIGENEDAVRQLAEESLKHAQETTRVLNSVETMTRSVQRVAEQAQQVTIAAHTASDQAATGETAIDLTVQNIMALRDTIGDTSKKVKRLGEASQQITRVVALMNQIAVQTNLLAINVGMEAARSGEQHPGFAVVAEEVGELAAQSAAANREAEAVVQQIRSGTNDVSQAIEQSTLQVVKGSRLATDAKQSLAQVLEVAHQIDELVQFISTTTASQAQTAKEVKHLLKDVAQVSSQTSQFSTKVANSLQRAVEATHDLRTSVRPFNVDAKL